jgi:hypothetical protein
MGFSTGGALTLDAISGDAQVNWGNIFLFSPAIGLGGQLIHICENAPTAAMVQVFMPYTGGEKTPANDGLGEDHHYTSWASNGACQLNSIVRSNSNVRDLIGKRIADQHIGVFAVESMADTTVDPVAVVDFVDNLAGQTRTKLITYPKGNDNDPGTIKHNDVPRPVENESDGRHGNPRFDEMIRDLGAFLGPPSAGAAADAEKQAQTREADRISRNVNRVLGEEGLGL